VGSANRIAQFPAVAGRVLAEGYADIRPVEVDHLVASCVEPFGHRLEIGAKFDGDVGSGRRVVVRILSQVNLCTVWKLEPPGHRKVLGWRHPLITQDLHEERGLIVLTADGNCEVDVVEFGHALKSSAGGWR
jgi:hypothetical protein